MNTKSKLPAALISAINVTVFLLNVTVYYLTIWLLFSLVSWTNPLELHDAARGLAIVVAFIIEIANTVENEKKAKA
jgi:hypothetical protein